MQSVCMFATNPLLLGIFYHNKCDIHISYVLFFIYNKVSEFVRPVLRYRNLVILEHCLQHIYRIKKNPKRRNFFWQNENTSSSVRESCLRIFSCFYAHLICIVFILFTGRNFSWLLYICLFLIFCRCKISW